MSAIWGVRDAGLRALKDVAVIGVGNIPEGEITPPPLTTAGPPAGRWSDVTSVPFSRLEHPAPIDRPVRLTPGTLILRGPA